MMSNMTEIEGVWRLVQHETPKESRSINEIPDSAFLIICGNHYRFAAEGKTYVEAFFTIDDNASPKEINLYYQMPTDDACSIPGVYSLEGNRLTIYLAEKRPEELVFNPALKSGYCVYTRA